MLASIVAIFSALAPLCLATTAPVTMIRIPKRVRVSVDRFEDADGNARVGREFAIGYYEKPLDGDDDYYRAVECGVVGLDVRLVHRCDCRAATGTRERPRTDRDDDRRGGAAIDVSYRLFLYVDDGDRRATYFSAAVDGDAVVRRGNDSATVPAEWFDRDGGLFGPNGTTRAAGAETPATGSDGTRTIDAIDERAFKAWLSREFSDDRVFGNAGVDAVVDRPTAAFGRDPPCVEIPQDRPARDFRDFLPATGCYRVFSDRRCTGDSKTLFWRAESLNERGVFASAPTDRESPPFRVQSVTGCCRPRREKAMNGGGDEELVWSPSFSADGDYYPRPRDDGPNECACGSSASTVAEPLAADTDAAEPPASSSSESAAPSTGADTSADDFAELSTSAETKNKISTEPSSSDRVAPLDSTNGVTKNETKNKIATEPLSNVAEDDSTIVVQASLSIDPEAPFTSSDSITKPIVDAREDDFSEPLESVKTKNEIATEPSSSAVADDSTTSIWTSELSTTNTSVSTFDQSTEARTDKLDDLADDEGNETVTVPTIVDEAKKAVSIVWNFLSSLAEKVLLSTWSAYKLVQRTWMDDKESA